MVPIGALPAVPASTAERKAVPVPSSPTVASETTAYRTASERRQIVPSGRTAPGVPVIETSPEACPAALRETPQMDAQRSRCSSSAVSGMSWRASQSRYP